MKNFALKKPSYFALAMVVAFNSYAQTKQEEKETTILERITVVGEKKNQSLQTTASSVSLLSEEQINRSGLFDSNDLLNKIPNIVSTLNDNELPAVRGVSGTGPASGADAFLAGTRPRINYMIDGRTLGFNESTFQISSLWDVKQVEFYRGPQSTLQGRNSIAGAMAIHTENPTDEWLFKARAIVGSDNKKIASVAVSGALIEDVLSFRLSADNQSKDSWLDYEAFETDSNPKEYLSETYRGKLLFTPNDDFSALLNIGHSFGKRPQSERLARPFDDEVAFNINMPTFESTNDYVILDTNWYINDHVSFEVNASKTNFSTERHDQIGSGNVTIDGDETVIQPLLRMQSKDETLSGFIGLYIFNSQQDETIDLITGGAFDDETENKSIFGELTWQTTENVDVTIGGRYEQEDRYRKGSVANLFFVNFDETYKEFLPKATITYHVNDWTIGTTIGRGYNGGGAGVTFAPPFAEYTYDAEFVTNLEAFARGMAMDNTLSVTANVFYNSYDDMQLPYYLSESVSVIDNAQEATTYGFESNINYEWSSNANVFVNLGMLKTKLNKYESEIDSKNYQGNEFARSPAFSLDVGVHVEVIEHLTISGNVRYSDSYYSDALNSARGKIAPYTIANVQLSYLYKNSRWFIKADNVFDNNDVYFSYVGTTEATDGGNILRRSVSAGVELSF